MTNVGSDGAPFEARSRAPASSRRESCAPELVTRRVVLDGRTVALDVRPGDGVPVVLLHGIPGWRGTWSRVAARLAANHPVLVPDLLGFGESDAPPEEHFHAKEHADVILRLLDALGVEQAHLVGHDFGGPTALLLARRAPERVRTLALLATNTFVDTPIPFPLGIARVPILGALFFRVAFGRWGLLAAWRAATRDRVAFPLERYRRMLAFAAGVTWTRKIFYRSLRELPRLYADVQSSIEALAVPSAVLWGDSDPFFPRSVAERTAAAARATLHILPGCGHFVPEERPDAVAAHLEELFARAPGMRDFS